MKQILLITFLYFSPLLWTCLFNQGGAGGEVHSQVVDTLKRDSLILVLKNYDLRKKEMNQYNIIPADTQRAILLWDIFNSEDLFKQSVAQEKRIAELKMLSTKLNYKKGIANAITGEGMLMMSIKQDYKKALALLKQALEIRDQINDEIGIRWSYLQIGNCYTNQNNYTEAIAWLLKSTRLAEDKRDSLLLGLIYTGLSFNYQVTGNLIDAIKYQEKTVAFFAKSNKRIEYCMAILFLSYYNMLNNNLVKAKNLLIQADKIAAELNSLYVLDYYFEILGELNTKEGNHGQAILNFLLSNAMEDSLQITQNIPYNYRNIAECILKADKHQLAIAGIPESKRFDDAIRYCQKSLELTIPSNIIEITSDNYLFLSSAYYGKGNPTEALKYFKMGTVIRDSIYNSENSKTIQGLKMQYDSEKQEQQIALLSKDKALQLEKIEKQKTTRNAFIGGFILVALLAGVSYNRYRVKQKANAAIENTLTHLKNTQEQLVQQGKLAALGKMTSEVAAEIQHPLSDIKILSSENESLADAYANAKTESERNNILDKLEINFESINQKGKMADGIVKNVLMQSRR